MKYKVIKNFSLLLNNIIFTIPEKTIIINNETIIKNQKIHLEDEIILNNTEYFQVVDWKTDLVDYLKTNKIPQPSILAKKLYPFIEDLLQNNK